MLIPDEVRKCVVFLACNTVGGIKLAGTAFFISVPMQNVKDHQFIYLVTAKHVIDGIKDNSIDQFVHIRLNLKNKGADSMKASINQWLFHPDDASVDIAILPWAPSADVVDYRSIPSSMTATDEIIKTERIGIGDEVFMTGLFTSHFGQKKNLPIVRIGNIALMPEEPVWTNKLGFIDAYLIEARSIGGLSGSPVFVHTGGIRGGILTGSKFYLLGLMHGHWDLQISDTDIFVGDTVSTQQVNMGIAIVIPISKILEVLYQKKLIEDRRLKEAQIIKRQKTANVKGDNG